MNKSIKIVLIGVGILILLAVAFVVYAILRPMYVDREIGLNINVHNEWTELTPPSTMRIKRRFQAVTLVIDHAQHNTKTRELFLKDGTVIDTELQISDMQGNWYRLEGGGYTTG